MRNRDIDRAPVQLEFDFGMGGSGAGHSNSSSLLFNYITAPNHIFEAWAKFCRGKSARLDVQTYKRDLEKNLFYLQELLVSGQYQHGAYQPFTICDPKQRQIHKATVQDRVVHQLLVDAIEPLFEPRFIFDSYSCRKEKGTHTAVRRLKTFLSRASHNNTQTVYALKCDVKQFFASVDHRILLRLLSQKISDPKTLLLLEQVIASLLVQKGKGIPLGNLTSQLFANIYLHEFDWFVKNTLREKYYLRYCDDFIILGSDRRRLLGLVPALAEFLRERLALSLHPQKITIRSWGQGIDFLGYVTKPHCTVLRHKTKLRILRKVDQTNLSSYTGLCSHANEHRLGQLLINKATGE